jgi:D-threo-aldose 1-dehydrogenase
MSTNNIVIKGTDIVTTSLGFGCGRLMRAPLSRGRQALLNVAFDCGIRYFDVARMYGLGRVENEVGKFIRGRRDQVVIATKFGIEVRQSAGQVVALQSLARLVLKAVPALRKAAASRAGGLYIPKNFGAVAARRSLEASLKALGTDYVDLLLLHEPTLADVRASEVCEFLENAQQAGQIRAWGVAGYTDDALPVCAALPELAGIIQLPNDAVNRQIRYFNQYKDSALITFSPFSDALGLILEHLRSDNAVCRRWSDSLGMDMSMPGNAANLLLGYCLQVNPDGVVLFSSSRRDGVVSGAEVWRRGVTQEIMQMFLSLVDEEIVLKDNGRKQL